MSDLDVLIRSSLEEQAPRRDPDWRDVVSRAGARRRGRPIAVAVVAAAALVLGAAALAQSLGHGFGDWLEGSPGTPASSADQDNLKNRKSFVPLDPNVDVRELLRAEYEGHTYRLIGFRTGGAVCLRLADTDIDEGGDVSCASGDQLARSHDLAVPLAIDKPLKDSGPSGKPTGQASFGLVAAETQRVVLDGDDGPADARVGGGAFLLLAPGPAVQHTTLRGYAIDRDGARRAIPVAPALTAEIDQYRTGLPLLGPEVVGRTVAEGSIAWLSQGDPRGEPVPPALARILLPHRRPPSLPARFRGPFGLDLAGGDFARIVQPDLADFLRMVVGRTTDDEVCYYEVGRGGVGGSCAPADELFAVGRPFRDGQTYAGVGTQFIVVSGIASDDVAQLEVFLGNGDVQRVGLRDNAFVARIQRAKLPGRLVAYDAGGTVIGLSTIRPT